MQERSLLEQELSSALHPRGKLCQAVCTPIALALKGAEGVTEACWLPDWLQVHQETPISKA